MSKLNNKIELDDLLNDLTREESIKERILEQLSKSVDPPPLRNPLEDFVISSYASTVMPSTSNPFFRR